MDQHLQGGLWIELQCVCVCLCVWEGGESPEVGDQKCNGTMSDRSNVKKPIDVSYSTDMNQNRLISKNTFVLDGFLKNVMFSIMS